MIAYICYVFTGEKNPDIISPDIEINFIPQTPIYKYRYVYPDNKRFMSLILFFSQSSNKSGFIMVNS